LKPLLLFHLGSIFEELSAKLTEGVMLDYAENSVSFASFPHKECFSAIITVEIVQIEQSARRFRATSTKAEPQSDTMRIRYPV